MEGYRATGESSGAHMIGIEDGETFDDAIKNCMDKNKDHGISENKRSRYVSDEAYKNRSSNWNIWACNLYDNEKEARKSFG